MAGKSSITVERLRELLDYDSGTGVFRWRFRRNGIRAGRVAGADRGQGHLAIKVDDRSYQAHRLAWLYVYGEWPPEEIDHIDTVRHHNWISNLRLATRPQNQANARRRADSSSGFKGVYWNAEQRKWRARIQHAGRRILIGDFETAEQAHAAYVTMACELSGEFANGG